MKKLAKRDTLIENPLDRIEQLEEKVRRLETIALTAGAADQRYAALADGFGTEAAAWVAAEGAMLMMRGLRGAWTFTSVDTLGNAFDFSGQGRTLTNVGSMATVSAGLATYASHDGSTQYWTRAHESALNPSSQLTAMGWFWFDVLAASTLYAAVGKGASTPGNYAYLVDYFNAPRFSISDGSSTYTATSTKNIGADTWVFLAGRHSGGSGVIDITVGDSSGLTTTANTSGIPASINNATSTPFQIGARNGSAHLYGRSALCLLSTVYLQDAFLQAYFRHTRDLFGV